MKEKVQPHLVGLTLGLFVGGIHLVWSILVMTNYAKTLMDFILGLHFLSNPFKFLPFDVTTTLILVIITFVVGYTVGYIIGNLWNWVVKRN